MCIKNLTLVLAIAVLVSSCSKAPSSGQPASSSGEDAGNKAIYERLMKAYRTNDKNVLEELIDEEFVSHNPDANVQGSGKEAWIATAALYVSANPDMASESMITIAEGDWVAGTAIVSATNTGEVAGGLKPTGQSWKATALDMIRFEDGKAVEHWGLIDAAKMATAVRPDKKIEAAPGTTPVPLDPNGAH